MKHFEESKALEKAFEELEDWMQHNLTDDETLYFKAMISHLKSLPPVESQWIPCSERLPEKPAGDSERYWYGDTDIQMDQYIVMITGAQIPTALYWTGSEWFDPSTNTIYPVIAWRPFPEPYKEGENL